MRALRCPQWGNIIIHNTGLCPQWGNKIRILGRYLSVWGIYVTKGHTCKQRQVKWSRQVPPLFSLSVLPGKYYSKLTNWPADNHFLFSVSQGKGTFYCSKGNTHWNSCLKQKSVLKFQKKCFSSASPHMIFTRKFQVWRKEIFFVKIVIKSHVPNCYCTVFTNSGNTCHKNGKCCTFIVRSKWIGMPKSGVEFGENFWSIPSCNAYMHSIVLLFCTSCGNMLSGLDLAVLLRQESVTFSKLSIKMRNSWLL